MIASLPMYDARRGDVQALWTALRARLHHHGMADAPATLQWPQDLVAHWLAPDLLLSQACGYPLTHALLHRVTLLGTFCYDAPGCEGPLYRSLLVARAADGRGASAAGRSVVDFKGQRLAVNSLDSQSGYHSLCSLLPEFDSAAEPYFASIQVSGSHRGSIESVRSGEADLAAIDCVTLAALQAGQPATMSGLAIVGSTALSPGLPLITSLDASPEDVRRLLGSLRDVLADTELAPLRKRLFISGFEQLSWADYLDIGTHETSLDARA